ncbi:uroporphyrinogen decarboxylase family protein, partial [candidate division KSB1 bacterium]
MNGRERMLAALEHREVDRVPIGFFAIDYDTVQKILGRETYLRAKARSEIAFWEGRRDEVVESWKEDMIELYRKLDILDIINLNAMATGVAPPRGYVPDEVPRPIDDVTWEYADGRVLRYSETTADLTVIHDPNTWTRSYSPEDFPEEPEVEAPDESCFEMVDAVIEAFSGERFILGPTGREAAWVLLGGMERGLTEFALNPELVKGAIRSEVARGNVEDRWNIRPGTDGVLWGEDFAYRSGPFINPKTFREICLPGIKERVANVKGYGLKVVKHACGNNNALLPAFVEAGYDAYQSIQSSAGMDLGEVKRNYGDKISLWGGVRVENLVNGTAEEVRGDVRRAMEIGPPGG